MNTRFLLLAMMAAIATIGLPAVSTPADAAPTEMLANGDFAAGDTHWTLEQTGVATGRIEIVKEGPNGKAAMRLEVLTLDDKPWKLQICQKEFQIKKGVTYLLSFWAKSDHPVPISVNCMQNHAPWEHHGAAEEVTLSTEWKQTQFKFVGPYDDDNMRITFTNLAVAAGQLFWFADCSLREVPPSMAGSPPLLSASVTGAGAGEKKTVTSQSDLPRHSYAVPTAVSDLVQATDAAFDAFAGKIRADIELLFRDYDIQDRAALRDYLFTELSLQEIAGEFPAALASIEKLRSLEDKPSPKLTTGLAARAFLHAAIQTGATSGPAFEAEFAKRYAAEVDGLPWDVVQDWARQSYARARLSARANLLGQVMTWIDPAAQKSHALNDDDAGTLVAIRANLRYFLPLAPVQARVLGRYIAAHDSTKPSIWADREVTLTADQKLTPVLVGIWDSGIDVSLFPNQLFTDPNPTASGAHGLAFADDGAPSTTWVYILTPEQQATYPEIRSDIQGRLDIKEGHDSPEAAALEKKVKTLSAQELHRLGEIEKVIDFYIHGTHCAGIAVRGNPAARLVVARFDDQLPDLPFPPTVEWARRLGADFKQMADFFRTRNVRVVNMSWGDDRQEFETWLSRTGAGADPAGRKKQAAELYAVWREGIETALKSAPGTLFVTAAGNSDSNTGFTEDVPSSLRLPNLIAVGAVNQAGEETSFTSYGESVAVHADGYDVESYVPGGARLKLSGTSMASPNVVNLAAKLFALDPTLTPEQVIALIKQGAGATEDGRRHLIDEKRSVALLLAQQRK